MCLIKGVENVFQMNELHVRLVVKICGDVKFIVYYTDVRARVLRDTNQSPVNPQSIPSGYCTNKPVSLVILQGIQWETDGIGTGVSVSALDMQQEFQ